MATVHGAARKAGFASKRAASNPTVELLERAGYVVRGVIYAIMGGLALGLALGRGGAATDPSGTVTILTSIPAGRLWLGIVVVGLAAYSLWGFVRAVFDPLHRGHDPSGIAQRLGFVSSGIAYSSIALFALRLLIGKVTSKTQDSLQLTVAKILSYPFGEFVTMVVGVIAIGVGLGQLVEAYRAIFKRDLKRTTMSAAERKIVDTLGRVGMVSRGVTFTLVGWFVFQGGLHRDPVEVRGYGGAFLFLLAEPFGRVLAGAVALGFIALGLHSFACARWVRLLGTGR